jgi:hypothetical protein
MAVACELYDGDFGFHARASIMGIAILHRR